MKKKLLLSLGLLLLVIMAGAQPQQTDRSEPFKNERDKASYAFGMNIGQGWKAGRVDMDPEVVARGLKDSLAGGETLLTESEMRETLAKFGRELRVLQHQHREQIAEDNRRLGEAFLARNKTNEDVVSLPSGLQVQDHHRGERAKSGFDKLGKPEIPRRTDQWN